MCDAIRHRGPDSDGYFLEDDVALGMRRLSVIDVSGGRQPISNEDGTVTVVFNGEIYNHHQLRARLEATGHTFATHSDTEVLVHLYEEEGEDMARHLHGMFAFAIWDSVRKKLFIARDRVGMKPLSYLQTSRGLLFCSELRSLAASGLVDLRVDPAAVMQFLAFGYVPDPQCIFAGGAKLPPGHQLTWTREGGVRVSAYWRPSQPDAHGPDDEELIRGIRQRLDHAVASHLESEVPLGAFLSGGLDSSTVVGLMSRAAPGRVRTFSIGFSEERYDETPVAREVAKFFGTLHTELIVQPDVEALFHDIVGIFDEPFADASAIPTFLVSKLARQSVTVALSGDGGDELFGGYTRYRTALAGHEPGPFAAMFAAAGLMLPHFFPGSGRLVNRGRSRWGQYAATIMHPLRLDEGGIGATSQPLAARSIQSIVGEYVGENTPADFAAAMMRLDLVTYLPGDILTKVDRTSMAVSLEARAPLLDYALVDFALAIPGHRHVTREESKRLFRRAIAGIVPDFVLQGPKRGFEVPLGQWFRGPLRHRIEQLTATTQDVADFLDPAAVARLVREHIVGRRDHSYVLWRIIALHAWLQSYSRGDLSKPPALFSGHGI
jgi:asparagine synthase (glutamine-hydrolysing)